MPTGDAHALLLAQYADELRPHYRIWELPYEDLGRIVNKTTLYEAARQAGAPIIPSLSTPTVAEVTAWSAQHPGPYLLKPSYDGIGTCKLRGKNLLLETREAAHQSCQNSWCRRTRDPADDPWRRRQHL